MSRVLPFPVIEGGKKNAKPTVPPRNWKLSPSDFAFAWEECKRCFYLKVVNGFQRPRSIMPKIFTTIDLEMKNCFAGKHTCEVLGSLPVGTFEYSEKWVESAPIEIPGHRSTCFVRGKFDTVLKLDGGSYAIVDFKTSDRNSEHIPLYARQLHAYALALENPADGKLRLEPISRLGLLVFEPSTFCNQGEMCLLGGSLGWIEIPRNDGAFLQFLREVLNVLEQPNPPGGNASCQWCGYRDTSRRTGL